MTKRSIAILLAAAGLLGACSATTQQAQTTGQPKRNPFAYEGKLSNTMDCNRLTLSQRLFINQYRYGCADLPTPSDNR